MTTEQEMYLKWHKQSGFAVGDEVEVVRAPISKEMGWDNVWMSEQEQTVGRVFKITWNSAEYGLACGFVLGDNDGTRHPYFVLRLVKKAPPVKKVEISPQYTAEVSESGIKVGCTTFTHDKLDELHAASKEVLGGKNAEAVTPCKWRKLSDEEYIKEGDVFGFGGMEVGDNCDKWNKVPFGEDPTVVFVGETVGRAKSKNDSAVVARKI